jgi:hypothetical protein
MWVSIQLYPRTTISLPAHKGGEAYRYVVQNIQFEFMGQMPQAAAKNSRPGFRCRGNF